MSDQRRSSLRRVSVARTAILVVLVLLALASFTPMLGPFRILFRGVLMLGVVVLLGSYLWPWIRRFWPVIRRAWRAGRD
ncbi:hypothetical protein [Pseudolysinimonas sp.]|uniref:hypothetical protein n=1 Tax=Pseudolysinimonas sp. TaxID=2680009 RepID=UPI003F7D7324